MKALRIFGILALMFVPVSANAHAGVVATLPAQDQVLASMPTEISIKFSENLLTITDQEVNTISLTHFDGPPVDISGVTVTGSTLSAVVPEGEYESGVYEVSYTIVSADGHKVTDSFTFSLNAPVTTSLSNPPARGDGVLPLPIVFAIAVVVALGGFFALRARRK